MNLLDKFNEIEIKTDTRIPESDRTFCEVHQRAYDSARSCFQELSYIWDDVVFSQKDILSKVETEVNRYSTYLPSDSDFRISSQSIDGHINSLHTRFICNLVAYFNTKYHVKIDSSITRDILLPEEPPPNHYDWEQRIAATNAYQEELRALSLRYEDVLEQIFIQLNGRSFSEQALYELKEKCHQAAWCTYNKQPSYELKKDTIRLTGVACTYSTWRHGSPWELSEDTKKILSGIAHFETGSFSVLPSSISRLLGYTYHDTDTLTFPDCEKIKQLRLFKNRRVDIKFTSAGCAKEFVSEYLGLVWEVTA